MQACYLPVLVAIVPLPPGLIACVGMVFLSMRLHPSRSRGGGYSRDYESSDRGRGGGGFRDDRGGFPDRGQADRGDRRGFGSNYEHDDRRGGSFRDRPRGDYGNLLPFVSGLPH